MGNWLSDKYAEGAPGHRLYAGCDNVDFIEARADELACRLFGAHHAYAQPHSGIDANLVAFWAVLSQRIEGPALERLGVRHVNDVGDEDWEALRQQLGNQTLLGMSLQAGGHLTHGFRPNISGKLFRHRSYGVDADTSLLDYNEVRRRAHEERPLVLLAGYSSYPRLINFRVLREIADEVDATFMVDMAHFAGLVAGKAFTGDYNPVSYAHIVTTTTHKTLRGPRGGLVLCRDELAEFVDRGCPLVLGGPLPHVMAAKAVALAEASQPSFGDYAAAVVDNARTLAEALLRAGVKVVTGGTDNHLVLIDVRGFGLNGRQAEAAVRAAGITLNRNVVPDETNGP
jgi:glycine hydroxymethyltransferase